MATNTTRYNLIKPALTDAPPDITVMNANWDTIDNALPLSANLNIYVSTSGNDTGGNGTSASPYKTINKALSVIPKDLGGNDVRIYLASGTYNEIVTISHFGNGRILFVGANDTTANVSVTGIDVLNTHYCQFGSTVALTVGTGSLTVNNNSLVVASGNITINGGQYALSTEVNACFVSSGTLTINNATTAVRANGGSCKLNTINGTGNTTGFYSIVGGKITFNNATNLEATTKYQAAAGGRIYTGSQTSIPNY